MTHKAACRLPKKPSELITVALADLIKAERSPRYDVNMAGWHEAASPLAPIYDPVTCEVTEKYEVCGVCFAGAVMAFSLNVPTSITIRPPSFPKEVENKLNAINYFRIGDIASGVGVLGLAEKKRDKALNAFRDDDDRSSHVDVVEYEDDPAEFKRQMRAMAKKFASIGL